MNSFQRRLLLGLAFCLFLVLVDMKEFHSGWCERSANIVEVRELRIEKKEQYFYKIFAKVIFEKDLSGPIQMKNLFKVGTLNDSLEHLPCNKINLQGSCFYHDICQNKSEQCPFHFVRSTVPPCECPIKKGSYEMDFGVLDSRNFNAFQNARPVKVMLYVRLQLFANKRRIMCVEDSIEA